MENEERRELYSGSTMILFTLTRFFQQVISCFVNQVWSAGPGVGRRQDGEAGAVGGGGGGRGLSSVRWLPQPSLQHAGGPCQGKVQFSNHYSSQKLF